MNQEDKKYLDELRAQSINELQDILPAIENQPPEAKFNMAMNLLQYGFNKQLLGIARDAIQKIEDPESKAELLSQLINEVTYWQDQNVDMAQNAIPTQPEQS